MEYLRLSWVHVYEREGEREFYDFRVATKNSLNIQMSEKYSTPFFQLSQLRNLGNTLTSALVWTCESFLWEEGVMPGVVELTA